MATTVNLPSLADMGIEDRQTMNTGISSAISRVVNQSVQQMDTFWATDLSAPTKRVVKAMDRFWSTPVA